MPLPHLSFQPAIYFELLHDFSFLPTEDENIKISQRRRALLTHSEKRIRARASLRRIRLSICLGVAVITC